MTQGRPRTSFAKEVYYILCLVVFIVSAIFAIWGPGGLKELKKAQRELEIQRSSLEVLRQSNGDRIRSINALKTDRVALEAYARTKGYVRKDEIVQQLPSSPDARKSPPKP